SIRPQGGGVPRTIRVSGLFGSFALEGALQSVVEGGLGLLVFLLRNVPLLVVDFELEKLFFQSFEQHGGRAMGRVSGARLDRALSSFSERFGFVVLKLFAFDSESLGAKSRLGFTGVSPGLKDSPVGSLLT